MHSVVLPCLQEVFSVQPLTAVEQLRRTEFIPPALLSDYQKLLSSQIPRRLNPAKVRLAVGKQVLHFGLG